MWYNVGMANIPVLMGSGVLDDSALRQSSLHGVLYWCFFPLIFLFKLFFWSCKIVLLLVVWPISLAVYMTNRKKKQKNITEINLKIPVSELDKLKKVNK